MTDQAEHEALRLEVEELRLEVEELRRERRRLEQRIMVMAEQQREIGNLRAAFRRNALRFGAKNSEIDRVLNGCKP